MQQNAIWVGMDVHKKSIVVASITTDEDALERITVPNNASGVRRLVQKLKAHQRPLKCCYEAGPCGFVLQRKLQQVDISCAVIAPTLIPVQKGNRPHLTPRCREDGTEAEAKTRTDCTPPWRGEAAG